MLKVNDYVRERYTKKPTQEQMINAVFGKSQPKPQNVYVVNESHQFAKELYDEAFGEFLANALKKATEVIKKGAETVSAPFKAIAADYANELKRVGAEMYTKQLIAAGLFQTNYNDPNIKKTIDLLFTKYPDYMKGVVTAVQNLQKTTDVKNEEALKTALKNALSRVEQLIIKNDPNKLAQQLSGDSADQGDQANQQEPAKVKAVASNQAVETEPGIKTALPKVETAIETADPNADVVGVVTGKQFGQQVIRVAEQFGLKFGKGTKDDPRNYNLILVRNKPKA